jgi:uncharacterized protein (DUF697 family)
VNPTDRPDLGHELERITRGDADRRSIGRLTRAVASSARKAGRRAVLSGQWATEQIVDLAPRIPVRDLETLKAHHGGLSGAALAGELIRNASRVAGTVGMASGALVSAEEFSPPAWVAIPLELVVETLAVVAVELKLVAELHEVYGRPVQGTPSERASALVRAWAERRGVTPAVLTKPGGLSEVLGRGTRNELIRVARRRMLQRMGRNLSSLAPLMIGAVAGAEVNRRATRALGEAVVRDLAVAPRP